MDQYLNWVTLMGVGLIAVGCGLFTFAVSAAKGLAPPRHRRRTRGTHSRRPAAGGVFIRGVATTLGPVIAQPGRPEPGAVVSASAGLEPRAATVVSPGAGPAGELGASRMATAVMPSMRQPWIQPSALLADTIRLSEVAPPVGSPVDPPLPEGAGASPAPGALGPVSVPWAAGRAR